MPHRLNLMLVSLVSAVFLSGCLATKAVSLTASGLYNGAKLAGKTVYYTGKGVYTVGKMTVNMADGVQGGQADMLRLTILSKDPYGGTVRTVRDIPAETLDAELEALANTDNVTDVFVEEVQV